MNKKIIASILISVILSTVFSIGCYKLLSKQDWKLPGGGGADGEPPIPTGTIVAFFSNTIPIGWLLCDGKVIPDEYTDLKVLIGLNVPDLRGMFLRGMQGTRSDGKGDPDTTSRTGGNAIGSMQDDEFKSHNHYMGNIFYYTYHFGGGAGDAEHGSQNTGNTGGSETRPKNVYVNYIIKY